MSSFPAVPISNVFNTLDYNDIIDGSLSLSDADARYFKINGGTVSGFSTFLNSLDVIGTLSINSVPVDLNLISGVTTGTPAPNKALSLDASGNINGALNCSQLNTNLTSSGLAFQSIAGSSIIGLNHTLNATGLLGSISNTSFGFMTNNIERVRILNNGNVCIGTVTSIYKLDVSGDIYTNSILRVNRATNGQTFNSTCGTSSCVLFHFNNGDAFFGTSSVNNLILQTNNAARMIISSTGGITGISSLTAASLIASTSISVNGIDVASNLAPLIGITPGTCSASKALIADSNRDITNINSLNTTSLIVNGVSIASSDIAYLSSITPGIVSANKALVVDSNKDITNINSLTATTLVGTLSTAAQPSITSVGTLTTLSMSNGSNASINLTDVSSTVRLLSNTQNATNSTSGAFRTGGGIYCGAGSWFNTTLKVVGTLTGADATLTSLDIKDNSQANNSRIEYQTIGKYVSSSDYSAWSTNIYYQNVTGDTANYITWCPSAKTSTSTGFGMVMNRNGQVSFQDSNSNSGSGGLVVGGNIIATVDIYGGVSRYISANGVLRSNATPAVYNASGGSTRISLFVQNAIWCSDQIYASSDKRLKRNIEPIELNEAKKLLNVPTVSYRWIRDKFDDYPKNIGLIAQDVIDNGLDKLVSYCPNNDEENFPEGYNYGIDYSRVPIYLLELIKDLYKQIDELKKK